VQGEATDSTIVKIWKPTREQLAAAQDKVISDLIAPNLKVLFIGINPGLYSGATGHHFARPGNRFWPALHLGGFTPRLLSPFEESELLKFGCGITNVVRRTTATAAELRPEEYVEGGKRLEKMIRKHKPVVAAFLGVGAYRTAFDQPKAAIGRQETRIGESIVWVLPNPSGLNAHYQVGELAKLFRALREFAEAVQRDDRA
jgi:TDG/mug DNA glycosylase family protein